MSGSSDAGLTISTSWLDEGQVGAAYFSDSEGKPKERRLTPEPDWRIISSGLSCYVTGIPTVAGIGFFRARRGGIEPTTFDVHNLLAARYLQRTPLRHN